MSAQPPGTDADRWILHVDLDQFVAAVELLRRPELRGLPVVVGTSGDPAQRRAVVTTASYEARAFGVHSGMPLRLAARKCPEAVFLASDPAAYEAASAGVMATLRSFPVVVEVWGWDEAFLGAPTTDPMALARDLQAAVLAETALACSVGVGDNKLRAKIATGFAKPAGVCRLTAAEWPGLMGHRPVQALWGVGSRSTKRLAALGISTVADLAAADVAALVAEFGPAMGPWYQRLGRGEGETTVDPAPRIARSRSRERTYAVDLAGPAEVQAALAVLARELAADPEIAARSVTRVAVKVRTSSFFTQTRIMKLPAPTRSADDIERAALTVLTRFTLDRPVRLLGVRVEFTAG